MTRIAGSPAAETTLIVFAGVTCEQYLEMLLGHGYATSVIQADGTTKEPEARAVPMMAVFTSGGSNAIDLLATPAPH